MRSIRFACFCTAQTSIFQKNSSNYLAFFTLEIRKRLQFVQISSRCSLISMRFHFVAMFADFKDICSDFLRFCRKCGKTLQLLIISRFQFNFHHDYSGDLYHFRLNFRFHFQLNFHRTAPPSVGEHAGSLAFHLPSGSPVPPLQEGDTPR